MTTARAPKLAPETPADQSPQLDRIEEKVNAIHDTLLAWSQSYYWTPEWQGRERRADEQAKSGASKTFGSVEDLIEELQG